jgi:putative flippase GtrA
VLLRTLMGARFSDAQCGFKAIGRDQARALLPLTQDTGWFFDTELLMLAQRAGLRIHEVPVDWIDDLDSRVDIVGTALADLRGMARLGAGFARGTIQVPQLRGLSLAARRNGAEPAEFSSLPWQIARFAVVGAGCTLAYLGLYLLLRGSMPAQAANLISLLLLTAVANTTANRRLTFGISGRPNAARHQFKGLLTFSIGLALTAGSLAVLHANSPHPGRGAEIAVLLAANLVAGALRFALCRTWVFGRSERSAGRPPAETDDSARAEPTRPSPVEPFGSTVQLTALTAQREKTS